jgi:isopentenyldiphosphate isomerase
MAAHEEELFQVFDENEQALPDLVRRSVVHREGLLHRSVNVLLVNSAGSLLLQRRMPTKDVCPDLWDISVWC